MLLSPPPFARPSLEKKKEITKYTGDAVQWSYNKAVLIKTHLTDKGDQVDGLVVVAGTPPVQMLNQTLSAMQVLVTEKDRIATVEDDLHFIS